MLRGCVETVRRFAMCCSRPVPDPARVLEPMALVAVDSSGTWERGYIQVAGAFPGAKVHFHSGVGEQQCFWEIRGLVRALGLGEVHKLVDRTEAQWQGCHRELFPALLAPSVQVASARVSDRHRQARGAGNTQDYA
eukprot:5219995-Alexandrium_andersonii.AAC.2